MALAVQDIIREFSRRQCAIIPHIEDLADILSVWIIRTTASSMKQRDLALLNTLEAMKDKTVEDVIMFLAGREKEYAEKHADKGDGTDPED